MDTERTYPSRDVSLGLYGEVLRVRIALNLDPNRIRFWLLWAAGLFVGTSLAVQLLFNTDTWVFSEGLQDRFLNVDAEDNIPTWFSSAMLFVVAFARSQREVGRDRLSWQLLSLTALVVSFDEVTTYHERVGARLRDLADTSGALHHVWVVPAVVLFGVVGLVCLKTVQAIPPPHRRAIVIGATLMAAGALGFELVAGLFSDDPDSVMYTLCVHAEEGLEMFGAILLLTALLVYAGTPVDVAGEVEADALPN